MSWLKELYHASCALFHRRRLDRKPDQELCFNVEFQVKPDSEAGLNAEKARYAAPRQSGWLDRIGNRCHEQWGTARFESLAQDLRFVLRLLRKSPGFTTTVVLTFAISIGASTAIISMAERLLLNPLPVRDPHRLVRIQEVNVLKHYEAGVSPPLFADLLARTDLFESLAAFSSTFEVFPGRDFPERVYGTEATAAFFEMLQAKPLLGQVFLPGETEPDSTGEIVLSYRLWQSHFGANPRVIGRTIVLGGRLHTILGIMPSSFQFPCGAEFNQFWKLKAFSVQEYDEPEQRSYVNWDVIARLRPGVSPGQTGAALEVMTHTLALAYPEPAREWTIRVTPARSILVTAGLQTTIWSLLVGLLFVLAVACTNIANMLLAMSEMRRKEIAVRMAIGANRFRIIRQLLTEAMLLAIWGGLLGLLVARWGIQVLPLFLPADLPQLRAITMDWVVFAVAMVISSLTGLASCIAPILLTSRVRLDEALKEAGHSRSDGPGSRAIQSSLAIAQIALAFVLLIGAGLMTCSIANLLRVQLGFDPKGLLYASLTLPEDAYRNSERGETWTRVTADRLGSLPGVESVSVCASNTDWYKVEGLAAPVQFIKKGIGIASNDYFRVARVPLVAGRLLDETDGTQGQHTILVSETLARLCWPGDNPLGKRIAHATDPLALMEVVGVVGDTKNWRLDEPVRPTFYEPYRRSACGMEVSFVIRSSLDAALLFQPIRGVAKEVSPSTPAPNILLVERELYASTRERRIYTWLLNLCGIVAVALAAIGLYGLLASSVAQRRREIGIRMAMGATRGEILRMSLCQGGRLLLIGLLAGLVAAFWFTHLIRRLLFGVSASDPMVFAGVTVVLCIVALVACYVPARKASRIDPMAALRYE